MDWDIVNMNTLPDDNKDIKFNLSNSDSSFQHFRNYTNAKVRSLLQDVIGIPLAFTRQTDLDQLRSVNNSLERNEYFGDRPSVYKSQREMISTDEVEIPVKKFPQESISHNSEGSSASTQHSEKDITKDVPLYSQVSNALFHLQHSSDTKSTWTRIDSFRSTGEGDIFGLHPPGVNRMPLFAAHDMIKSGRLNIMKKIQLTLNDELNRSSVLRSEYSLLPYLIVSPYSPIKLSIDSKYDPKDYRFPYCHAFRDLIETSFAKEKNTSESLPGWNLADMIRRNRPVISVHDYLDWIQELYHVGLLQQRENISVSCPFQRAPFINYRSNNEIFGLHAEFDEHNLSTKWAFPYLGDRNIKDYFIGGIFEPIYNEYETLLKKISPSLSDVLNKFNFDDKLINDGKPEVNKRILDPKNDSNIVVSSETSLIQRIDQDGNIRTSLEQRQMFADGHQTVKTTFKEDKPWSSDKNQGGNTEDRLQSANQLEGFSIQKSKDLTEESGKKIWGNWLWK